MTDLARSETAVATSSGGNVVPFLPPRLSESGEDGIDLLLQMARKGDIDPWNLDIETVADAYLQAVSAMSSRDLSVTGKTLLYLAILLRMKSDLLQGVEPFQPPLEEADFGDFGEEGLAWLEAHSGGQLHFGQLTLPYRSVGDLISRRTSTKQKRIRRVTLTDLITELKRFEALEQERALKRSLEKRETRFHPALDYSDFTADTIEDMAHEEFIEDVVLRLKDLLVAYFEHGEPVSLTQLMTEGGLDKISAFLAVLFLTARQEADLEQTELYGELYVHPPNRQPLDLAVAEAEALATPLQVPASPAIIATKSSQTH